MLLSVEVQVAVKVTVDEECVSVQVVVYTNVAFVAVEFDVGDAEEWLEEREVVVEFAEFKGRDDVDPAEASEELLG